MATPDHLPSCSDQSSDCSSLIVAGAVTCWSNSFPQWVRGLCCPVILDPDPQVRLACAGLFFRVPVGAGASPATAGLPGVRLLIHVRRLWGCPRSPLAPRVTPAWRYIVLESPCSSWLKPGPSDSTACPHHCCTPGIKYPRCQYMVGAQLGPEPPLQ